MNNYHPNKITFWSELIPWLGTMVLLPVVVYYTINEGKFTLIDYINLLIHEGGHGIFKIFGKFLYTIGGTLMQIIIPGMFVVYYIVKRKRFGAQVFLVWLGENLLNISAYAADAQTRKLPLLGGNKVYHDWNWILRQVNLLEYDYLVGSVFYFIGAILFITALLIPLLIRERGRVNLNIDT